MILQAGDNRHLMRWKIVTVVVLLLIAAIAYAEAVDRLEANPVSVVDRSSGNPIPGVVVVAVWTRNQFTLESSGEGKAIRVYEAVTGPDGVARIPTTYLAHLPTQGVSRQSPHIVIIKAGWMRATQWDARWNQHTVFQRWDDSEQAHNDLAIYVELYCEFMNWYEVHPDQMKQYRREIAAWIEHCRGTSGSTPVKVWCEIPH